MPSSGGLQQDNVSATYGFTKQQSMPALRPPAYRQPPPGPARNSSPAEPPPYREPPPPGSVRPPHYSPPPTHRSTHLSRHPSRSSLGGSRGNNSGGFPQHHGLPYRQQQQTHPNYPPPPASNYPPPPASSSSTDFSELMNLVTAQQSTLQNQHSDMKQVKHRFFKKTFFCSYRLKSVITDASKFRSGLKRIFKIGRLLLRNCCYGQKIIFIPDQNFKLSVISLFELDC